MEKDSSANQARLPADRMDRSELLSSSDVGISCRLLYSTLTRGDYIQAVVLAVAAVRWPSPPEVNPSRPAPPPSQPEPQLVLSDGW